MITIRILISKFTTWSSELYKKSQHPEFVAIRRLISKHKNHEFILVGTGGDRNSHFIESSISFYNFANRTKLSYFLSFIHRFLLCLRSRPTVTVSLGTIDVVPFGLASIINKKKFVCVITSEIFFDVSQIAFKPFRKISLFLLKIVLLKADKVLSISESTKKEIEHLGISPEKIVNYSYEISEIFAPNVEKSLKQTLNANGKIILTISRLSPAKGLEYLIDAGSIIKKEIPNVKIVIKSNVSSDSAYEKKLFDLIKKSNLSDTVKIIKQNVPYSMIPKYMAVADVFVLPSISEGLGIVILEALATGTPVVASNTGGIPDMIVNEHNGLLVQPCDTQGLANALKRMLLDDKLRHCLITNGLSTVNAARDHEFSIVLSKTIFTS